MDKKMEARIAKANHEAGRRLDLSALCKTIATLAADAGMDRKEIGNILTHEAIQTFIDGGMTEIEAKRYINELFTKQFRL